MCDTWKAVRDLPNTQVAVLQREHGRASDHAQVARLSQRPDEFFRHAIGECAVALIGAEVGKRNHRDGR